MNDWGLLESSYLWVSAAVVIFGWIIVRLERRILKFQRELSPLNTSIPRSRIIFPILLAGIISIALLRPYFGKQSTIINGTSSTDIFLVIDVSISMLAQDASPTRIEFARRKARDIVSAAMRSAKDSRIGIILFAGDAYVFCPLTSDFAVVSQFLQHIDADLVTARGSSLSRALEVSRIALTDAKSQSGKVVILSDGEDLKNSPGSLIQAIDSFPGNILFLGIGSEEGVPIPLPQGGYLSANQQIVKTKLNASEIAPVFSRDHSRFLKATLFDSDFASLLEAPLIGSSGQVQASSRTVATYGELGPFILSIALIIILAGSLFNLPVFFFLLVAMLPLRTQAQSNPFNDSPAYEGYRAYQQGDYAKAYQDFSKAAQSDPKNPRLLNSLASSAFKIGKFEEAEHLFEEAAKNAGASKLGFDALYGSGNAALEQKKYRDAIDAYNQALKIDGTDRRALQNKAIAEKLLVEEQNQQKKEAENNQNQQKKEEVKQEQNQEQTPESSQTRAAEEFSKESAQQNSEHESPSARETPPAEENPASKDQNQENQTPSPSDHSRESPESGENPQANETTPLPGASENQKSLAKESEEQIPLSEAQAREWLEALPETPLLLQRLNKRERINPGDQFW